MDQIRKVTRCFKSSNRLDRVIFLWTANTEHSSAVEEKVNNTAENVFSSPSIKMGEAEVRG